MGPNYDDYNSNYSIYTTESLFLVDLNLNEMHKH